MPFWVKVILLTIAVGAFVILVLWGASLVSLVFASWVRDHPSETAAVVTVLVLSIVAVLWRIFLWEEEK